MRVPRIHVELPLSTGATVELPATAARHVQRVLRLHTGAALVLFDGHGAEYAARISAGDRHRVRCSVGQPLPSLPEPALHITLLQGIARGERMDLTIQKAVELGASAIVPVRCARSTVRLDAARARRRLEHWQAVVTAACEQCGRSRVPLVAPIADLDEAVRGTPAAARLLLRAGVATALAGQPAPQSPALALLAGPEGGLDAAELRCAEDAGFTAVHLGPRILRTETAAVAALAAIQALWGDWR